MRTNSFQLHPVPLKAAKAHYVYDPGSNEIIEVDTVIYKAVEKAFESENPGRYWANSTLPPNSAAELEEAQRHGLLRSDLIEVADYPTRDQCHSFYASGKVTPKVLVLELTEDCNLRCKYCCFSGGSSFRRSRGKRAATKEHIKKAIDWYRNQLFPESECFITFYGGEPLLAYDTILYAVDYALSVFHRENPPGFAITTNATLLTYERAFELLDRGVNIDVSLDGPRHVHNRFRILPDGKGSYETVIRNLSSIHNNLGTKIFNRYITLVATLDIKTLWSDSMSWLELMEDVPFLRETRKHFALIRRQGKYQTLESKSTALSTEFQAEIAVIERYMNWVVKERKWDSELTSSIFDNDLSTIHNRHRTFLQGQTYRWGACIPGDMRVYVTIDGEFLTCEKVDSRNSIGDLHSGINVEKATNTLEAWNNSIAEICSGCWAIRFCKMCPSTVSDSEDVKAIIAERCSATQEAWLWLLSLYCVIMEHDSHALDYLHTKHLEML